MSPNPLRLAAVCVIIIVGIVSAAPMRAGRQGAAPATGAPAAAPTGLILGRVIDGASNRPLPGVVIKAAVGGAPTDVTAVRARPLTAATGPTAAMTNSQGEFLFRDLEPGAYSLTTQFSGYLPGGYGQRRPQGTPETLAVEAGARVTDVTIRLWQYGAINGTVFDETGEPVVNVAVRVLRRQTVAGRRQLIPLLPLGARTDDRGVYRMGSLPPGEYAIAVSSTTATAPAATAQAGLFGRGGAGVRMGDWQVQFGEDITPQPRADGRIFVYPTVFHPGTVRPSEASVVTVRPGDEHSGIDVRLSVVPALRVSGTITGPDSVRPQLRLQIVPADTGVALASGYEAATAVAAADGRFAFIGVPAGQYLIKALQVPPPVVAPRPSDQSATLQVGSTMTSLGTGSAPPPTASSDPTLWAEVPVTLTDRDVDDIAVVLRTGARLIGRVEFDGPTPRPPPDMLQRMYFSFETLGGTPSGLALGRIDARGLFTTAEYPPGRYFIRMHPQAAPGPEGPRPQQTEDGTWTLESFLVNGRNATEVPFEVGTQDIRDVVVTYTTRVGEISGSIQRRMSGGSGDPDAVVVLFPADLQTRLADGARDRTQIVDVRPNGTFRATGLLAGEYLVAAVDASAMPLDMQNATTVAALARVATRVTLGRGDSRALSLAVGSIR